MASTATEGGLASRTIVDKSTLTLLEHVNLNVPNHEFILPFYFLTLGCGMDPRKVRNLLPDAPKKTLWANCGASQFHLPYGDVPQRIPGHIGLRYDTLQGLKRRICRPDLKASFQSADVGEDSRTGREFVKLVDNYDNVFFCRAGDPTNVDKRQPIISSTDVAEWGNAAEKFGREESDCRGIDYVEFDCPHSTAERIALFYEAVFDATTTYIPGEAGASDIAIVAFGEIDSSGKSDQSLIFRESNGEMREYDGHHIAMYVGESAEDFYQAFRNAKLANIVWCNPRFSDQVQTLDQAEEEKQFRFKDIVDMETGEKIFELEHEIRSIGHPSWPGQKQS